MAGPTISRGEFYGGDEGKTSVVASASGAVSPGASPALFWVAALVMLIFIRLLWEGAD